MRVDKVITTAAAVAILRSLRRGMFPIAALLLMWKMEIHSHKMAEMVISMIVIKEHSPYITIIAI